MPLLKELYKKHLKKDIYIVGTGPTLRLFPFDYFKDKIVIGLNQAYRHFTKLDYCLTIHPYLIPIDQFDWNCQWITKVKISDENWQLHVFRKNDTKFCLFNNNNNPLDFSFLHPGKRGENNLYVGCGIHTGAMHLAALMGAKNIILVGCDFGALQSDKDGIIAQHHAHEQHIEPHQYSMEEVYQEYYFYAERVRHLLKSYYKVNVLNLSACLGIPKYAYLDFIKADIYPFNEPKVIEKNKRATPLIRNFISDRS